MRHRRPPRLPDAEYVGPTQIFFTMNTFKRRPHFTTGAVVLPILDELLHTTRECAVETIAYCFMPNHLSTRSSKEPRKRRTHKRVQIDSDSEQARTTGARRGAGCGRRDTSTDRF